MSYGPGRMGFGLFVPEFKSTFALSSSTVGFIASLGFCGFFIGLLVAQSLLNRMGPKMPVLTGLFAAMVGMSIIALAQNAAMLALGVILAASSAGFAWTPFNDPVHRKIRDWDRPTALSLISTGTGVGVIAAGFAALALVFADLSWRYCWTFFALAGFAVLILNWSVLRQIDRPPARETTMPWRALRHVMAIPLFAIAFVYGATSAIYISFAPDAFWAHGGVPGTPTAATPAFVFLCYGVFGLTGLLAGHVKQAIGLPCILRLLMLTSAVSLVLVAVIPASWPALIVSAGLQGIHVMMTSAVLAFWSERLFPQLPSFSFTAALLATAAGSILGPAAAGIISDTFSPDAMFIAAAALPVITALILRNRHAHERAATSPAP
ncbi:MAG: MFS transporter [Pseudomonadota bacterium]|nr:MFS transporter [Roseovarius sp. EGI FJ00037]